MDLATDRIGETPGVNIIFDKMEEDHVPQPWMEDRRCSPQDISDLWCEQTEPSPGTTFSTRSVQPQLQKVKADVISLDEEQMLDRLLRLENDIAKLTDSDSIATLAARYRRLENRIAAMADSDGLQKTKIARLEDTVDFLLSRSSTQCWSTYLEPFEFQ